MDFRGTPVFFNVITRWRYCQTFCKVIEYNMAASPVREEQAQGSL